jgi:AcrR family transcriptional regulator
MTTSARSAARKLSRREELGVESRRKIVDAAAALMAERGFAGTSIAAVSQRSGLPSGSIYWHFDNKEALLSAVIEEGARRWFDSLGSSEPLPTDAAARAEALFERAAASLESQPEFLRLLILIALERREVDKASVAVIRRVRALALRYIRDLVVDLFDAFDRGKAKRLADDFSRLVLCVADGAFLANHIDPADTDVRKTFDLLRRALTALARELLEAQSQPRRKGR